MDRPDLHLAGSDASPGHLYSRLDGLLPQDDLQHETAPADQGPPAEDIPRPRPQDQRRRQVKGAGGGKTLSLTIRSICQPKNTLPS